MDHHRFVFLDGLRGVAALSVVIFHFTAMGGQFKPYLPSAALAVDLFFCMSGFVIAFAYYEKLLGKMGFIEYCQKRLIRLYPMFLIGLMLGAMAFALKFFMGTDKYTEAEVIKGTLINIFYLPYFVDPKLGRIDSTFIVNSPSWSLFFELVANIAFLATIRFSKLALVVLTAVLGGAMVYAAFYFGESPGWSTTNFMGGFPRVGYSFMVGVLIYKFFPLLKRVPKVNYLALTVALIIVFAMPMQYRIKYWILCALVVMPAIVILGSRVEVKSVAADKIFTYFGWISYPLYCVHSPILHAFMAFKPDPSHFWLLVAIMTISAIAVAHVTGKFIDEPARKSLSNWVRGKGVALKRID